jgi:hypothetical protein
MTAVPPEPGPLRVNRAHFLESGLTTSTGSNPISIFAVEPPGWKRKVSILNSSYRACSRSSARENRKYPEEKRVARPLSTSISISNA